MESNAGRTDMQQCRACLKQSDLSILQNVGHQGLKPGSPTRWPISAATSSSL